jgi:hypothetical protein
MAEVLGPPGYRENAVMRDSGPDPATRKNSSTSVSVTTSSAQRVTCFAAIVDLSGRRPGLLGRLDSHVRRVGELGVGGAAHALPGIGGTDAKTDRGGGGNNRDLHGSGPSSLVEGGSAYLSQPPMPGISREGDEPYVGRLSLRSADRSDQRVSSSRLTA